MENLTLDNVSPSQDDVGLADGRLDRGDVYTGLLHCPPDDMRSDGYWCVTDPEDSTRHTHTRNAYCDPTVTIAEQIEYLVCAVGVTDAWGVSVTVNEHDSYAEVGLVVPAMLSDSAKVNLAGLSRQRVDYTVEDREWDQVHGYPQYRWRNANGFVRAVREAREYSHALLTSACFAHARGEEWLCDLTPPKRPEKHQGEFCASQ